MPIQDLHKVIYGQQKQDSHLKIAKNLALVDVLKKWGEKKNSTPGQISLAWLLHQKPWIVPIPGTTQMAHMLENNGATAVKFSADELSQFNKEVNEIKIQGARLPDFVQAFSDVEAPLKK